MALSKEQLENAWRVTPIGYGKRLSDNVDYEFKAPRHIWLIVKAIVYAVMGWGPKRIIISLPPRHAKSSTVSHWCVVWLLDMFPNLKVLLGTYQAEFASEWGYKVRTTIESHPDLLQVKVDPKFGARNAWYTTAGGGMFTAGVGGPFTGRGANLFIIDDPYANFEEAHSEVIRNKVWNWFTSTASTRMEPGGVMVIVMTRWHEDDIVGRIKKEMAAGGEQWKLIELPAIAEEGDLLGRKPGEALWPERYDEVALLGENRDGLGGIKRVQGPYKWSALYQQHPAPPEGQIVKREWWNEWIFSPSPNAFEELIQSWDMAFKGNDDSDYVVGQVWGRIGADRYLLDQVRAQVDIVETIELVRRMTAKWPAARTKLVEDAANGPAVIATLNREISGLRAVSADKSKEGRLHAVVPEIAAGNVYLPTPQYAPWIHDFIEEVTAFPHGANDDQLDAMTQALNYFGPSYVVETEFYTDNRLSGRR